MNEDVRRRLRGSIAPIITPFTRSGEVDHQKLRGLIDWSIENGSHGISVTGTTGEPSSLSLEEREQVMATAKAAVAGRVPFVPGTGSNNLQETLRLTAYAEALGADACLVIVPYYVRPSQQGLFDYFRTVAQSTRMPVVIYNIPGRTAINLEPDTIARIAKACPNVVGVKEANKDFEHVCRVMHACGRDFLLFSGIELLCYPMLAIGGAGHISATASLAPKEVARIYDLAASGQHSAALDLHYELLPLNEVLFVETNPGPLKAALAMTGRIDVGFRLPLALPSTRNCQRIQKVLQQYGIATPKADEVLRAAAELEAA